MDDSLRPSEGISASIPAPQSKLNLPAEVPPGFRPIRLVLRPGGFSIELTSADMLFGRSSDADVRLQLPDVSRKHCRFVFADDKWQVIDLGSLNGVIVNGKKVPKAYLQHLDLVRIGGYKLEVDLQTSANQEKRKAS